MSRKLSICAMFTAFAVILSYIESLIPILAIPGIKLGLANLAIVLAIYILGYKEAIIINIVRILIIGSFFGNLFSICFSIVGAVFSFVAMMVLKVSDRVSIISIAITGGVFHNLGQILVASLVVETYSIFSYVPILMISGIITGMIIGIVSDIVYRRIDKIIKIR